MDTINTVIMNAVRHHPYEGLMFVSDEDFPAGRFSHLDQNMFVGCDVNRAFTKGNWTEFMWVYITGVKDGYLTGKLINHPLSLSDLKDGDDVTVTVDQIVDVNFLNADIPKEQKRRLADAYIGI